MIRQYFLTNQCAIIYSGRTNYRTAVAKARFLNGQSLCFVWCEFEDSKGKKRPRLLLSTDMQLSGLDIIVALNFSLLL